jgi:hypothetical protein
MINAVNQMLEGKAVIKNKNNNLVGILVDG